MKIVRALFFGWLIAGWSALAIANNDQQLQANPTEIRLEIVNGCELNGQRDSANLGTLDFGGVYNLDFAITAETTLGNGSLSLKCTPGTNARIFLNKGTHGTDIDNRVMLNVPSGQTLRYQLYTTPARNIVWDDVVGVSVAFINDDEQLIPIFGTIPVQALPVSGLYTDVVTVTVQY